MVIVPARPVITYHLYNYPPNTVKRIKGAWPKRQWQNYAGLAHHEVMVVIVPEAFLQSVLGVVIEAKVTPLYDAVIMYNLCFYDYHVRARCGRTFD